MFCVQYLCRVQACRSTPAWAVLQLHQSGSRAYLLVQSSHQPTAVKPPWAGQHATGRILSTRNNAQPRTKRTQRASLMKNVADEPSQGPMKGPPSISDTKRCMHTSTPPCTRTLCRLCVTDREGVYTSLQQQHENTATTVEKLQAAAQLLMHHHILQHSRISQEWLEALRASKAHK